MTEQSFEVDDHIITDELNKVGKTNSYKWTTRCKGQYFANIR